jgi:raffinose/stachyose/melibiose transport system permease protein
MNRILSVQTNKQVIGIIAIEVLLLIVTLIIFVPLLMMFLGSFKDSLEVTAFNLKLPRVWHFENYLEVIKEGNLLLAFFNSIFITFISVVLTILVSSTASFILARRKARLTEFLYFFFFAGMLMPMQVIPTIGVFKVLHLYGSYLSAMLIYCATNISFSCFLYTGFIKGIPKDLDEAAMIEGASLWRVFFSIIFPLLRPVNITVFMLVFMSIWNDIYIPLYFLPDPNKWTMPLSVYNFFGQYQGSNWNLVFADLTLTALPVILLYFFAQKYIVSGLTAGALKG